MPTCYLRPISELRARERFAPLAEWREPTLERKWTFFISSTLEDLREERQAVANQLLKMEEIPIGMEQFGAIDKSSWENIETFIDTADYYILIIAGKYGSIDEAAGGISYTEREYWYAKSKNIPIIAVLHGDPESLPSKLSEQSPDKKEKLDSFRQEVKSVRLVAFYKDNADLIGEVSAAIGKAKQRFPRPGWVRDTQDRNNLVEEIQRLKSELAHAYYMIEASKKNKHKGKSNKENEPFDQIRYENTMKLLETVYDLEVKYEQDGALKKQQLSSPVYDLFIKLSHHVFKWGQVDHFQHTLQYVLSRDKNIVQADPYSMRVDINESYLLESLLHNVGVFKKDANKLCVFTALGRKIYVDYRLSKGLSLDTENTGILGHPDTEP